MSYEKITKDTMYGIILLCICICVQVKRFVDWLIWLESPNKK